MSFRKEDKNNLIILGVMLAMIAFIVICYTGTRYLPLKWIGIICMAVMFVLMAMINKKYMEVYRFDAGISTYIPFFNAISIFTPVIALALCAVLVIAIIALVLTFLPASVLMKVMSTQAAMNFGGKSLSVAYVALYFVFFILGAGYCSIYRDVRRMLYNATGMACPKLECVNYGLMFLPVINVLGMSAILTGLNRLQRYHYHEGVQEDDTELSEVK